MCDWFLGCDDDPAGVVAHPVLGDVLTCQLCADRAGETLQPMPPVIENVEYVADDGSVVIFAGDRVGDGRRVRFVVDHRAAAEMIELLELEVIEQVVVADWQVIG